MIEKLYTVEEVAELASVTGRTIRNYLKSGRLVGRKIGGQWRFPEAEVQRLLNGAPPDPLYAHVQDNTADFADRADGIPDESAYAHPAGPSFEDDILAGAAAEPTPQYVIPESAAPPPRYAQPVPTPGAMPAPVAAAPVYTAPAQQPGYAQPYAAYPTYEQQPPMAAEQPVAVQYAVQRPVAAQPVQGQATYVDTRYAAPVMPVYQPVTAVQPAKPMQQPVAAQPPKAQQPVMPYAYTVQPSIPMSSPPSPSGTAYYAAPAPLQAGADQGIGSVEPVFQLDSSYQQEPPPKQYEAAPPEPVRYQPEPERPYEAVLPEPTRYQPTMEKAYEPAAPEPTQYRPAPERPYEPAAGVAAQYQPEPEPVGESPYRPGAAPAMERAYQTEPPTPTQEPAEKPEAKEAASPDADLMRNFSEVGKRVARFVAEVHDASDGPVMCSVIDVNQTLDKARLSSERISAMAEEESEGGTLCQSFVEYDDRYCVARYSLFGTSNFLRRCVELIGEPPASAKQEKPPGLN